MPKFLEDRLKKEAAKKGKSGKAAARYVYGTMNKIGAMKGNKETAKGRSMEAKHARDTGGKSGGGRKRGKSMASMSADEIEKKYGNRRIDV